MKSKARCSKCRLSARKQQDRRGYKACFKRVQYDQGGHKGRRVLGREGDRLADNAQNSKRESKKRKGGEEVQLAAKTGTKDKKPKTLQRRRF